MTVDLAGIPLRVHAAWQEHAETLLREYLLHCLDDPAAGDPIQMHADATDAIAILVEQVPRPGASGGNGQAGADASTQATVDHLYITVPVASVPHFTILDRAIEAAIELAHAGEILAPPTTPEVRAFRHWVCRQVVDQASGGTPTPWSWPSR